MFFRLFLLLLALGGAALAEAPAVWTGTINAAFDTGKHRWAGPFTEPLGRLAEQFGGDVDADLDALPADRLNLLYGDPGSHPALGAVLAWHHIALDAEGVTLGDTRLKAPDPFLIAALPLPDQPERPCLVYTAWSVEAQPTLNRVFHGPTAVLVGSRVNGKLETLFQGSFQVDAQGRLKSLGLAPAWLSGAEAAEDLRALASQLDQGYAGLEDLDAALQAEGRSWAVALEEQERSFNAVDRWRWDEVAAALRALLDPVNDAHFTLRGAAVLEDGTFVKREDRLARRWLPWFADARLFETAAGYTLNGQVIATPPPAVPTPEQAALGAPYRFPTVLADGSRAWLLGVFALDGEAPAPLTVGEQSLPLHLGQLGARSPWVPFALTPAAVPVLQVMTMNAARLRGLTATARPLRDKDRVVLDLRGNGGGSDSPARAWMHALRAGPLRWTGGANLSPGTAPRAARWQSWEGSTFGKPAPKNGFHGSLRVLIDGGVASSGETFVQLAAQLPGARLYGLNTMGCSRYGNLVEQAPLPYTGLVATFGHTRFDWHAVRPVAEGRGLFPDVWLDDAQPLGLIQSLP